MNNFTNLRLSLPDSTNLDLDAVIPGESITVSTLTFPPREISVGERPITVASVLELVDEMVEGDDHVFLEAFDYTTVGSHTEIMVSLGS